MSDDRPLDDRAPDDAMPAEDVADEQVPGTTAEADEAAPPADDEDPWSKLKPWQGRATRTDKALLFVVFGVPFIYLALLPFRPWMLVNAPVLQEFINGAKTAVVAAAAYARIGEIPLWVVIVVGVVGMAKLDWAFWLAGRRWGDGILRLFAQDERQLRRIQRLKGIPSWALFGMTMLGRCPGVPGTLVYLVAGWSRMRLWLFLTADILGCLIFTIIWTVLGYQLGEAAVDILKVVDRYALWLTLAIIVGIFVMSFYRESRKQKRAAAQETADDA